MLQIPLINSFNKVLYNLDIAESLNKILETILQKLYNINLLSEDTFYKKHFLNNILPELYQRHINNLYVNCTYCEKLVHSSCHKHCLKCSMGTYIHCSPLLPGIMYSNKNQNEGKSDLTRPWFYKKPCIHFKRLTEKKYMKNFTAPLGQITVYNFEILEGLRTGFLNGERPCHICAAEECNIYKSCLDSKDFDISTPCKKISTEIISLYKTSLNTPR